MDKTNLDKELFKLAFENANIGMTLVDLKGNFFKVNAEMSNIFGYSADELEQMNINDVTHPDYKHVSSEFIKKATEGKLSHSVFEKHYIHKSGKEIICKVTSSAVKNDSGTIQFFISNIQDVTAQKKAETKLKIEQERLKSIINNVGDPIFVKDNEHRIILANNSFCEIFCVEEKDVMGKTLAEHVPESERTHFLSVDRKVLDEGIEDLREETLTINNYPRTIVTRKNRFTAVSGEKMLIGSIHDITAYRQAEQELTEAKEKIEESNKLKTAFLQNLSHEIRTPLNSICGFSNMLNNPNLSDEKRKSFVSIIQTCSNQLLSIVSDILTVSLLETKQEKINIEKTNINNLIIELFSIFKGQSMTKNISLYLKKSLTDSQSEILTDKTKLVQILSNLLSNALKFTREGYVEFGYTLRDNELEFYVKDSGVGIEQNQQEKIFERFRQADISTNKEYGGTGLGLSICKEFSTLLGGEIRLESEIGKGSTFYFTIPYTPVNIPKESTEKSKHTILVAEDEELNFLYIEESLINFGFDIIHAKNGQQIVEIFENTENISLILMDIKMPILDGHEAAKIIKEKRPDLPIIAQSGYALEHEMDQYSGVFDDYLTKPIMENVLIEKINKYLKFK